MADYDADPDMMLGDKGYHSVTIRDEVRPWERARGKPYPNLTGLCSERKEGRRSLARGSSWRLTDADAYFGNSRNRT